MTQTHQLLNERLQPVYAQFLADNDIPTGDIDPITDEKLYRLEMQLADVIDTWMASAKPDAE